jgi:hypothetical protein
MARFTKITKINTKYLQQIIDSEDQRTHHGTDFGHVIEDVREELFKRQAIQADKELRAFEQEQRNAMLAQIDGKQCTHCLVVYSPDQIEANFYKVAGLANKNRYRPRCKACHVKASRQNRLDNKIPF